MSKKFRAILLSALYILYLLFIFPWYILFLMIANLTRRRRNSRVLKKNLRKQGLPEHLIDNVAKNYRRGTKIISIRNIRSLRQRRKLSKKEEIADD